jgi:hypothetical protein
MSFNRNHLSVVGLVGMILAASLMVHGPMIIPGFSTKKSGM